MDAISEDEGDIRQEDDVEEFQGMSDKDIFLNMLTIVSEELSVHMNNCTGEIQQSLPGDVRKELAHDHEFLDR